MSSNDPVFSNTIRSRPDGADERVHVKLVDGTTTPAVNQVKVDDNNTLHVSVQDSAGNVPVLEYGEVSSVAMSAETTLLTYTVPLGTDFFLHRVEVSGTNLAEYKVKVNSSTKSKKRTWWTQFNETFEFTGSVSKGVKLVAGDIVTITALHSSVNLGNFNASLQGMQVT